MRDRVDTADDQNAAATLGVCLFVGEFAHGLDGKKRLTIPSGWRAQLGAPNALVVLPDFYRPCLNAYPAEAMRLKLARLREQAYMGNETAMRFATELGAASDIVEWDAHGRIRICDKLLRFVKVSERAVLIGALDKIEIWNPEARTIGGEVDQAALRQFGSGIFF